MKMKNIQLRMFFFLHTIRKFGIILIGGIMNYLIGILLIVVIILIIALAKLLFSLASTVKSVNKVVNDNKRNIDIAILETSKNLEETSKLLKTINLKERELRETMDNVDNITTDIAVVTNTVANTVSKSEELLKTSVEVMKNFNNISKAFNKKDENEK